MTSILIVEDEESYSTPLAWQLRRDGYDVSVRADGASALDFLHTTPVDLILLDVMLPGVDGIEVARRVRAQDRTADIAIVMLTAKDEVIDRVVGLEVGADDYVAKPYSYRELHARIRALMRRTSRASAEEAPLRVGDLSVDIDRHEVRLKGVPVELTPREFDLLAYLAENAGRVMTRAQILDAVWGMSYEGDPKTLDVHITRLRAKLEEDPHAPTLIATVRGLGYKVLSQ